MRPWQRETLFLMVFSGAVLSGVKPGQDRSSLAGKVLSTRFKMLFKMLFKDHYQYIANLEDLS